jgi:arsenate reductase (thioredoxin)
MSGEVRRGPVIFVCEFGSKKSVLAASWFSRLAAERGVELHAVSRGVTPDPSVPDRIRSELLSHGVDVGAITPEAMTAADWTVAGTVVSFTEGPLEGSDGEAVISWADVPALSDDFDVAWSDIRKRVASLLDELSEG